MQNTGKNFTDLQLLYTLYLTRFYCNFVLLLLTRVFTLVRLSLVILGLFMLCDPKNVIWYLFIAFMILGLCYLYDILGVYNTCSFHYKKLEQFTKDYDSELLRNRLSELKTIDFLATPQIKCLYFYAKNLVNMEYSRFHLSYDHDEIRYTHIQRLVILIATMGSSYKGKI